MIIKANVNARTVKTIIPGLFLIFLNILFLLIFAFNDEVMYVYQVSRGRYM